MFDKPTVMKRSKPSLPARTAYEDDWPVGEKVLDYGCGYGLDAETYGWERYDPHFFPDYPFTSAYDTVFCTYALCTVGPREGMMMLREINSKIHFDGWNRSCGYLTVVRGRIGPNQFYIELDLPTYHKESGFETYRMVKFPRPTPEIVIDWRQGG